MTFAKNTIKLGPLAQCRDLGSTIHKTTLVPSQRLENSLWDKSEFGIDLLSTNHISRLDAVQSDKVIPVLFSCPLSRETYRMRVDSIFGGISLALSLGTAAFALALPSSVGSISSLTLEQENEIEGGFWLTTATECIVGTGSCPANPVSPNVGCTTPGAACPGSFWCQSGPGDINWVCTAPYATRDQLDFNCVVDPPVSCWGASRFCSPTFTCSTIAVVPSPGPCGTRTNCHY